jgi:hypothetical protein
MQAHLALREHPQEVRQLDVGPVLGKEHGRSQSAVTLALFVSIYCVVGVVRAGVVVGPVRLFESQGLRAVPAGLSVLAPFE